MRLLTILAGVICMISLIANYSLWNSTYSLNSQKNVLQQRLNSQINRYELSQLRLKTANIDLYKMSNKLESSKRELSETKNDLSKAQDKLSGQERRMIQSRAFHMCYGEGITEDLSKISTDAEIILAIKRFVQNTNPGEVVAEKITPISTSKKNFVFELEYSPNGFDIRKQFYVIRWVEFGSKFMGLDVSGIKRIKSIQDINDDCMLYRATEEETSLLSPSFGD
jgi:hypothetical protein